jgi:hypothetical protein
MLDDPELSRAVALRAIRSQLLRLKWHVAATRFEIAMRRHDCALRRACKANFNPDQPRVPRGEDGAGQWTLVAGGASRGGRGRYGGNFPGATNGQLIRLDLEISRTENALQQIRQYDPNWKPTVESVITPDSIEGAIRNAQARAEQADARLSDLRSGIGGNFGPPLEAAQDNGGTLEGRTIEIHTDREMCPTSCFIVLPKLGLELGNPRVTFVGPNGSSRTMQNGKWQ